jgi:hypothetical protein
MAESDTSSVNPATIALKLFNHPPARRLLKWLAGIVIVIGILGFFAAPPLLKSLLIKELSAQLQRPVTIDAIEINPFALTARVNGVSVREAGGKETLGFDELFVNMSSLSMAQAAPVVDEIRLVGLRIAVARLADGKYDISDLLDEWLKPAPPSPTPRFSINNIQLLGASLLFDDQPVNKVHRISEINLRLPFISSMAYKADVSVTPHFSARFGDSPILLEGSSKPFTESRESELRITIDNFDLATLQPYLPAALPLRLTEGAIDSELKLIFKEVSEQLFSLSMSGAVQLSGLKIGDRSGNHLLGWKRMDVEIDSGDLVNQRFKVKGVALDGLDASLAVNRQGEFNLLLLADKLAAPATGKVPKATAGTPGTGLEWTLGEFRLNNGLLRWKDESTPTVTAGEVRNLNLQVGKIESGLQAPIEIAELSYQIDLGERMRVERMAAKNVRIDLHGHRVDVGEVSNSGTRVRLLRNKAGKIEWISSPLLKSVRKAEQELSDERPWVGSVRKLAVDDLNLRIEDQTTSPPAVQVIDGFKLSGENLSSEPNQSGSIALQTKINHGGSLKVAGSVQPVPLSARLKLETQGVSLTPLAPYLNELLTISLQRGILSSGGEVTLASAKQGVEAAYKGSLTLGDLLAVDRQSNADFLKWRSLHFAGIDFRLQPMAINVAEIALTDFYSRLVIDPQGQLNLAGIVKKPAEQAAAAPLPAPPADKLPGSPPVTPGKSDGDKAPAPPIKIVKITLQNGTVSFSDFFVKPSYSVKVGKLGGRVTGLSSAADSLADLDLRGTYAGSAPVTIAAKLNPLMSKPYLDLKAEISGVDLVGFSPYSGKYAGYNIEKGKLSMNLAYHLENNQLVADNRLFIDQFTFGDKVDSAVATTLPVNLAISLLKNNRGEIDLNLPISGSLDDPQFSIGGLIVKVIVNLFVKAVTSPFALLGSMVGGGEALSSVEFAAGRADLDTAATKKLESLARALNERDSLKLEITGRADPELDSEGIKRLAMYRAAKREKSKEIKDIDEAFELSAEEYPVYLKRAYQAAAFPKPRNLVGIQKDIPLEEMEKLMLTNVPATPDDLRELAVSRGEAVQLWLIDQGKVAPGRVFLLPPKLLKDEQGKAGRADFSLR